MKLTFKQVAPQPGQPTARIWVHVWASAKERVLSWCPCLRKVRSGRVCVHVRLWLITFAYIYIQICCHIVCLGHRQSISHFPFPNPCLRAELPFFSPFRRGVGGAGLVGLGFPALGRVNFIWYFSFCAQRERKEVDLTKVFFLCFCIVDAFGFGAVSAGTC